MKSILVCYIVNAISNFKLNEKQVSKYFHSCELNGELIIVYFINL